MKRLLVSAVSTSVLLGCLIQAPPANAATCGISVAKDVSGNLTATVTWDPSDPAYAEATTTGKNMRIEIIQFAPNPLITAYVPLSAGSYSASVVAGQANVSGIVTAPNPAGSNNEYSAGTCFTGDAVVPDTKVSVTGISPNTAKEAGGGTAEITGANLASATSVTIGSKGASIVAAADDKVVVSIPVAGSNPVGTAVEVTVTTPAGSATLPGAFTYTSNPPSVASITPSCGVKAGTALVVGGFRFTGATSVTIGGQSVPFTVTDSTHISATAPALADVQPVIVTTSAGSSSGLTTVSYRPCSNVPPVSLTVTSTVAAGGFATIEWSFPAGDPNLGNVAGLQYGLKPGGPYANVGGTRSGNSGSFTVSGLTTSLVVVYVKTVNANPALGKDSVKPVAVTFATTPTPLPPNTGNAGSVPPPATPGSGSGSSSGSGSGSGSGIDPVSAPCLAPKGSLYPQAYGTVGSQLVVVPGRPGEESPTGVTITVGTLPPGMGLDTFTGIAYGVPTAAGRYSATVSGHYADGSKAAGTLDITVDNDAQTLTYPVLVAGGVGQTMTTGPTTNAPIGSTYELVCGKVVPGTTFDPKTGVISGTPTTEDLANPPLRVIERNAAGSAVASFLFVVGPKGLAQLSYPAHPHLKKGKTARIRPTVVAAGDILYYKVLRGKLNKGLTLSAKTGLITGKPRLSAKRPHNVTVAGVHADGSLVTSNPMAIYVRTRR